MSHPPSQRLRDLEVGIILPIGIIRDGFFLCPLTPDHNLHTARVDIQTEVAALSYKLTIGPMKPASLDAAVSLPPRRGAFSIGKAAGDRCARLQNSEEAVLKIQLSASRAAAVTLCDTVDGGRYGGRGFTFSGCSEIENEGFHQAR
jgi:hypothetical protein